MSELAKGRYVKHLGRRCFNPCALPPAFSLGLDTHNLLSQADRALARLDGAASTVPDPDLFIFAFLRQEASLSSQIEGTQATLDDVFAHEAGLKTKTTHDVGEIVNYLNALHWGINELEHTPLSLRVVKGMHAHLLSSGRGSSKQPGSFRDGQNFIGSPGAHEEEATFIPPAVPLMNEALKEWEAFLHDRTLPPLIRAAIAHAQFETIHPFWDGNGRVGRMLITLMLMNEKILEKPLLYQSLFFKTYRDDYYRLLQGTRDQLDWQSWIEFFLRGVRETSRKALDSARQINALRDETRSKAHALGRSSNNLAFADMIFRRPYLDARIVRKELDVTTQTAINLIDRFVEAGVLVRIHRETRNTLCSFDPYLGLLTSGFDF